MKLLQYLILALLISGPATSHTFMRHKAKPHELPPNFVLVQLKTGRNKIEYLQKAGKTEDLKKTIEDISTVNNLMIEDFSDNFAYCPVYYFYDTNRHLVVQKNYDGVLMDKEQKTISNPGIQRGDTSYFIIRYGVLEDAEELHEKTLVVAYASGYQLKYPLPYRPYPKYVHNIIDAHKKYTFKAPKYGVEYRGLASAYNATLERFYRSHLRRPSPGL